MASDEEAAAVELAALNGSGVGAHEGMVAVVVAESQPAANGEKSDGASKDGKAPRMRTPGTADAPAAKFQPVGRTRLADIEVAFVDPTTQSFRKLPRSVRRFYGGQNGEIEGIRELHKTLAGEGESAEDYMRRVRSVERHTSYVSSAVNVLLLVALVLAVVFSGALSIIASLMDSGLDFLSGLLMLAAAHLKRRVNIYHYPQGRERVEPVTVLMFSAVMGTASLLLIMQSVERLITNPFTPVDIDWVSIGIVLGDVAVKLALWAYCFSYRHVSSIPEVLAQDHRNDVFVNSFALGFALLGHYIWEPIDPMGSILICFWTIYNWSDTCLEQARLLTGLSATPEFHRKLTWIAYTHDERVLFIDTVRAFYFGSRFLVEMDIILPADMPLKEAHDIGEALQLKLELLTEVERAFVHLDYEFEHGPRSEHKQFGTNS